VNYLDIGRLWFIAFLAIITTITLIIFESDGRSIDNERNGNAPVHDTYQQTGDRARQAAFEPLARVIISDAYGEKAILVGYQAAYRAPRCRRRLWAFPSAVVRGRIARLVQG